MKKSPPTGNSYCEGPKAFYYIRLLSKGWCDDGFLFYRVFKTIFRPIIPLAKVFLGNSLLIQGSKVKDGPISLKSLSRIVCMAPGRKLIGAGKKNIAAE